MSTVIVRRNERHDPPELPSGEILLQSPPEIPEVTPDNFQQTLMYLPMLAMMVGMGSIRRPSSSPLLYVGGGAMALGMGGMMIGQMGRGKGERKNKLNGLRRDYLRYLGQVRRKVRQAATRSGRRWNGPAPSRAPSRPCSSIPSCDGSGSGGRPATTSPRSASAPARTGWRSGWCRRRPSRSRISTRCAPAPCAGSSGPTAASRAAGRHRAALVRADRARGRA